MTENKKELIREIEYALDPGGFVGWSESWDFVSRLDKLRKRLDEMVENGDACQSIEIFEIFLAGGYKKAEKIDDSYGNFGEFLEDLFRSWVKARQIAGMEPEETVKQILAWIENDRYGFCHGIEKELAGIFGKKEFKLFEKEYLEQIEKALEDEDGESKRIYDYPWEVRRRVSALKQMYNIRKNIAGYWNICEKVGVTPRDCENLAKIYKSQKKYEQALELVEKGLALEERARWPNEAGISLGKIKRQLLVQTGRKEEARNQAWAEFKARPGEYSYEELLEYVPEEEKDRWHEKAMKRVKNENLDLVIGLLTSVGETEILAQKILETKNNVLEKIGYYRLKGPLKVLKESYPRAAAKIYRALAMEILEDGRSKHYEYALSHLSKVREIYGPGSDEWKSVQEYIENEHSRKWSFYPKFKKLVAGKYPPERESFEQKVKKKWQKQISGEDN